MEKLTLTLTTENRLKQELKKAGINDPKTVTVLSINGIITADDMKYIRENMYNLQELDMSNASFEENKIPDGFFGRCRNLMYVTIPFSITKIEYTVFLWCKTLTSITVHPDNSAYSSENGILFNKDKSILVYYPDARQGDYIIPDSVKEIGEAAFRCCFGLTSITIPLSVTKIGNEVFQDCAGLTSITIPNSVIKIGDGAFYNCTGLNSINIPASVTEIGKELFLNSLKLTVITVHSDNPVYSSENGVLFNKNKTELLYHPEGRQGNYTVPDSVTEIVESAFCACPRLTSITIPASVIEIDCDAFYCDKVFTVHPDNPVYESKNGKIKIKEKKWVSGMFGELQWWLTDGVLTIKGNGEIPDYDDYHTPPGIGNNTEKGRSPWYRFREQIKKIVLDGEISKIGVYVFRGCKNISSVTFENFDTDALGGEHRSVDVIDKAIQGYGLVDLWNMDGWFCEHIPRMLQELKLKSCHWPYEMTYQEWAATLDRISFCFSESQKASHSSDEVKEEYCENMKNEGMKLFSKYLGYLWW